MDTKDTYLTDDFYVTMAGELPPEPIVEARKQHHQKRVEDPDSPIVGPEDWTPTPAKDHALVGEQPPVDGWITFYDPEKMEAGEAFKHFTFPFRSVEKEGLWFSRPDEGKWHRSPIWKWENPDADPHESLTLSPSIGVKGEDGITFHCYVKDGVIDWL